MVVSCDVLWRLWLWRIRARLRITEMRILTNTSLLLLRLRLIQEDLSLCCQYLPPRTCMSQSVLLLVHSPGSFFTLTADLHVLLSGHLSIVNFCHATHCLDPWSRFSLCAIFQHIRISNTKRGCVSISCRHPAGACQSGKANLKCLLMKHGQRQNLNDQISYLMWNLLSPPDTLYTKVKGDDLMCSKNIEDIMTDSFHNRNHITVRQNLIQS